MLQLLNHKAKHRSPLKGAGAHQVLLVAAAAYLLCNRVVSDIDRHKIGTEFMEPAHSIHSHQPLILARQIEKKSILLEHRCRMINGVTNIQQETCVRKNTA